MPEATTNPTAWTREGLLAAAHEDDRPALARALAMTSEDWRCEAVPSAQYPRVWHRGHRVTVVRLVLAAVTGRRLEDVPTDEVARHLCGPSCHRVRRPEGASNVARYPWRKACVNPAHLSWGSAEDNARDSVTDGTHAQTARTACPRGHRLEGANLRPASLARGKRSCLLCDRARTAVHNALRLRSEVLPLDVAVSREILRSDGGRLDVALAALGIYPPAPA